MSGRLWLWLHSFLIALDQLAFVLFAMPKYVLVGGQEPSPRETISSRVGRSAIASKRWALIAEQVIDWLAVMLGGRPNHCRRAIVAAYVLSGFPPSAA